jgi:hypothetical protein
LAAFNSNEDYDLSKFLNKKVDIEHILPINAPGAYKRKVAETEEIYDRAVRMLGNLALLEKPINTSGGNKGFEQKRKKFAKSRFTLTKHLAEKVEVGSNTSIDRIMNSFQHFEVWDIRTIRYRQAELRELARLVWEV